MLSQKKALLVTAALGVSISESTFRTYVKERIVSGIDNKDGRYSTRGVSAQYPDSSPYEAAAGKYMLSEKGNLGKYGTIRIARKLAMLQLSNAEFCLDRVQNHPEMLGELTEELVYDRENHTICMINDDFFVNFGDAVERAARWLYLYVGFKTNALINGDSELHYWGERELEHCASKADDIDNGIEVEGCYKWSTLFGKRDKCYTVEVDAQHKVFRVLGNGKAVETKIF